MKNSNKDNNLNKQVLDTIADAFQNVLLRIDDSEKKRKDIGRALFNGLTHSGKAKCLNDLYKSDNFETQKEIADEFGITQGRVSQLIKSDNLRLNKKNKK